MDDYRSGQLALFGSLVRSYFEPTSLPDNVKQEYGLWESYKSESDL